MNPTIEIDNEQIDMISTDFQARVDEYCNIFAEARIVMETRKSQEWVLNLEELNIIFASFNIKKQELIDYYSSLSPEQSKEYLTYLSTNFASEIWPQKRCIWEVIAGINNYIINNHKA